MTSDFNSDLAVSTASNQQFDFIRRDYVFHPHKPHSIGRVLAPQELINPAYPNLTISAERFRVPEVLFDATILGKPPGSIIDAILASISKCPEAVRDALLSNIIITGGSARLPNIKNRIRTELERRVHPTPVRIYSSLEPNGLSWRGAVEFTGLHGDQFEDFHSSHCVSKQEYEEYGYKAGRKKFVVYS